MAQQEDYFDENVPENMKELMQTKGIHRQVLEVRNLKAVTELCVKTTKNLKYQNITNLFYAVAGSLITFFITNYYSTKSKTESIEMMKLLVEKDSLKNNFETYRYETNKKLLELKSQLEAQKQIQEKQ